MPTRTGARTAVFRVFPGESGEGGTPARDGHAGSPGRSRLRLPGVTGIAGRDARDGSARPCRALRAPKSRAPALAWDAPSWSAPGSGRATPALRPSWEGGVPGCRSRQSLCRGQGRRRRAASLMARESARRGLAALRDMSERRLPGSGRGSSDPSRTGIVRQILPAVGLSSSWPSRENREMVGLPSGTTEQTDPPGGFRWSRLRIGRDSGCLRHCWRASGGRCGRCHQLLAIVARDSPREIANPGDCASNLAGRIVGRAGQWLRASASEPCGGNRATRPDARGFSHDPVVGALIAHPDIGAGGDRAPT